MNKPRKSSDGRKPGNKKRTGKPAGDKSKHPFKKFMGTQDSGRAPKRAPKRRESRPQGQEERQQESGRAPSGRRFFKKDDNRPFVKRESRETPGGSREERNHQRSRNEASDKKPYRKTSSTEESRGREFKRDKPSKSGFRGGNNNRAASSSREKRFDRDEFVSGQGFEKQPARKDHKPGQGLKQKSSRESDGLIRLNKYLSNAGIASRRDADQLIVSGAVKVNGVVVSQLGAKIRPGDKVTYGDQSVKGERKVYLLLNKPKDYITTVEDERDRKTVMKLVEGACKERIYPVGRLDRNTTGLLLMTNDGELTTKLTHPKHGIKKVYHVSLNKGLKPEHFKEILDGIELEDGLVKVDDLAFVGEGKKEVGVEIHSGKNRVVRRLFEHLGYDVIKLDRVVFAGLTKKDLPRGKYRFLSAKEISFLQMIG